MTYKKISQFWVALLLLLPSATAFVPVPAAAAPSSGDWISQTQISYNGQTFTDNKIDDTWEFHSNSDRSCDDIIHDFDGGEAGGNGAIKEKNPTGAYYLNRSKDPATGACKPGTSTKGAHITLNQVPNSKADFVWQNSSTIQGVTGSTFAKNTNDSLFYEQGGDQCKDTLQIVSNTSAKLIVRTGGNNTSYDSPNLWVYDPLFTSDSASTSTKDGCTVYGPANIALSDYNNASQAATPTDNGINISGSTGSGDTGPDINCGGLSLNWLLCPLEEGLTTAVRGIDAIINGLLQVDTSSIFSSCDPSKGGYCQTSAAYKSAWASMRAIALGLLVIAALIMVLSQAMGLEIMDAYTVRKVLPRLILAAVGITLSWQLLQFFVGFTNDLGQGIRTLIYAPFHGLPQSIALGNVGGLLGLLLGAVGGVLLGFGMLSFIATGLLAVLIAVLVLIIRQVLIVFLILVAPLAIVAFILPNTKKIYDVWWDFFAKALLMFPMIMAFIAAGRVFASVAATNAQATGINPAVKAVDGILAFVAYFAPYFLLPLTFRFAGGAIAGIGGFINDRSKGGFDRLRKYRAETAADRFKRAQSNSLWDNNSAVGKRANKIASWGTAPLSNAAYAGRNIPGLRKAGLKVASSIEHAKVEQSGKLFEELNKMGYNDKAYRALSGQHGDLSEHTRSALEAEGLLNKAPTSIPQLQRMAHIMSESDSDSERIGAEAIEGSIGRLANLYQDPEMMKANTQAAGIMGLAAHGFASGEDLAGAGNALAESGGASFAQSVVSQAQLLGVRSRPDTKPGYGVTLKEGRFVDGTSAEGGRAEALLETLSAQDLATAKGGALEKLKPTIYNRISGPQRAAQSNLSPEEKAQIQRKADAQKDQLFQWASPYSQASNDVKVKALQMIDELGLRQQFDETVNLRNLPPEQRARLMRPGGGPEEGGPMPGQGNLF